MATVLEAITARLRAPATKVSTVYVGGAEVDKLGQPVSERYAVLYPYPGRRTSEDLAQTSDRLDYRFQVSSVGTTAEQAVWVSEHCRDALLDTGLSDVSGVVVSTVRHTGSRPVVRDDDVPGNPLFVAVDTYEVDGFHH